MNILAKIKSAFSLMSDKECQDSYLSEATDLVDLERRMRNVDRGQAPYQIYYRNFAGMR